MNASQNFSILAALLISSAPSEKARVFAEKVIGKVQAKGGDWIEDNAMALEATSDHIDDFCPVRDNRVYFMTRLQLALAA